MPNDPCVRVNLLTEICDRRPKAAEDSSDRFFAVFGFKTQDLYSIALRFFKGWRDGMGVSVIPWEFFNGFASLQ